MNFSASNKGKVFYFPDQDEVTQDKRAWVRLRTVTNERLLKMADELQEHQVVLKKDDFGETKPVHWEETDNIAMFTAVWDFCIMEWGNIEVDDKPLECNVDNKMLLMGNDHYFSAWCAAWRKQLDTEIDELTAEARKNVSSTSNDSTTSPIV
jgi:hypothetical protein